MKTLGIDLSSMPKNTAACLLGWTKGVAKVISLNRKCDDDHLDKLIKEADVIGIDAPFGWPNDFRDAVSEWNRDTWNEKVRDGLAYRQTDRACKDCMGRSPLSVSTDRIALPAMRAMALLRRHRVSDKSGDGRFYEVYPAASLRAWGLQDTGYKQGEKAPLVRRKILRKLRKQMAWLDFGGMNFASDDEIDALIAAITAWCAANGHTTKPAEDEMKRARIEGWIHIPSILPKPG